jgi:hypothetical protein
MSANLFVRGTLIPIETFINTPEPLLIGRIINRLITSCRYVMSDRSEELTVMLITILKTKVKFTLEQAIKAQKGSRVIALLFL